MRTTQLRKVGGSVMLAVPPPLLDLLRLEVGARVTLDIRDGSLIVTPRRRPTYTLDELLAQCDDEIHAHEEDGVWLDARPVGRELL